MKCAVACPSLNFKVIISEDVLVIAVLLALIRTIIALWEAQTEIRPKEHRDVVLP